MFVSINSENLKELKEPLTSGAGGEVIWTNNQLKPLNTIFNHHSWCRVF